MNVKDELLKLKDKLVKVVQLDNSEEEGKKKIKNYQIDLDNKVSNFLDWYYKNYLEGSYSTSIETYFLRKFEDFIEKIAVWYELRYPDYEVNRLMHCCGQEDTKVSNEMFKKNFYIKDLLDENSDVKDLDWDEFYNTHAFIQSLPWTEKQYLSKPKYMKIVYLNSKEKSAHLHLTTNGFVDEAEGIISYTNGKIMDGELKGLHVYDVIKLFEERNICLPENNELELAIKKYENLKYKKEEMLNCVMYRIIERGGNRIGPRRAFLFAKEFNRNIDIPMMYAIDMTDPGLRDFIIEYIKAGGHTDLECYVGYFAKIYDTENVDTITIENLLLEYRNNGINFYTPEEDELHLRLVNILASQVDQTIVRPEEIRRLRLEKKQKSKMNRN